MRRALEAERPNSLQYRIRVLQLRSQPRCDFLWVRDSRNEQHRARERRARRAAANEPTAQLRAGRTDLRVAQARDRLYEGKGAQDLNPGPHVPNRERLRLLGQRLHPSAVRGLIEDEHPRIRETRARKLELVGRGAKSVWGYENGSMNENSPSTFLLVSPTREHAPLPQA